MKRRREARFARPAEEDLVAIAAWLAQEAGIEVAERVLRELRDAADRLAEHPAMGRARPELSPGLRSWPVPPYILFYRAQSYGVRIVRVLHGARDLRRAWRPDVS